MAAKCDEIMTMDELAEYLKMSKFTLYKLTAPTRPPFVGKVSSNATSGNSTRRWLR